ncbi:hypothetical protein [Nevskia sp.]|uniref:hypothetical protein n=1 Tax=Nevskia sp. TaxID=1929292 RepID=UPI0025E1D1DB|nr:hypothetical protein [Nevskia sp.]
MGTLDLRVVRPAVPVNLADIPLCHSLAQACAKCAEIAGSQDKSVALDTGLDAATWSKLKQGEAGIKGDFLDRLMDACGNEFPMLWLLHSRGYDPASIRKRESELERQLREQTEKLHAAESKLATITEFFAKARAA